jgi:hypothetical protein
MQNIDRGKTKTTLKILETADQTAMISTNPVLFSTNAVIFSTNVVALSTTGID